MTELPVDLNQVVGRHDIVLLTLDSLRYDVAQAAFEAGELPVLSRWLPADGWERRHTPGTFTLSAHQAFFAGFLPTPVGPHPHPRHFACAFEGSVSITERTAVFEAASIVEGLAMAGHRTLCVGGVGFFNQMAPLGCVLPGLFQQAFWSLDVSVHNPQSASAAVGQGVQMLEADASPALLFINFAATHQPTTYFVEGASTESPETQRAALRSIDAALEPLLESLQRRGAAYVFVCADHGTTHGEDGLWGHRLAHPLVTDVPFAEGWWPCT